MLASCSYDKTVCIWNVQTGRCDAVLTKHTACINSVSFAPRRFKGRQLLASAADDGTVRIWNCDTGKCVRVLRALPGDLITAAIFLPNVEKNDNATRLQLAYSSFDDCGICICNAETGGRNYTLLGHTMGVWSLSTCKNVSGDVFLASGSGDGTVRVWNVATRTCLHVLTVVPMEIFFSVAFTADGQRLVAGSSNAVRVWDVATQQIVSIYISPDKVTSIAWSIKSQNLIAANIDKTVHLLAAESGVSLRSLQRTTYSVECVAFSPDGKHFACSGGDGLYDVHVWALLNYHQLAIFLLLLRVNVAPYVMLDIVDLLLAHEAKNSIADESAFVHAAKIHFIVAMRHFQRNATVNLFDGVCRVNRPLPTSRKKIRTK